MSLGVLNNLSAMSAANNLNNTQNALSKTLQQLSSGSKINSGADDAAGLSLVNGLQANATALAQSQTNATEGVGLLTVADGALSQVTNLLNRAVTLATEVSNGTLNASQNTAANQEYQSILSEINNIGATTTYNQKAVFGSNTSIYVGDSSNQGASINQLNIRALSSANVGDSNGQMSYSNGSSNVFIDLSYGGKNAAVTDSLGTSAQTTTINVSYLTKGANGAAVQASANISVGAGTQYANTAQGLIDAVNNSGLGITATFGTANQAGSAAAATAVAANALAGTDLTSGLDTGIIITGTGIGVDNNTAANGYSNGAGEVGTVTVAAASDLLGGTLNITGSDGQNHQITLGITNSTDTLANLMATINSAGYGVSAAINNTSTTNAAGTFVAGTLMTLVSNSSTASVTGTNITDQQSTTTLTPTYTASNGLAGGVAAATQLASFSVNSATDTLNGMMAFSPAGASPQNAVNFNLNGKTLAQVFGGGGTASAALTAAGITATLSNNNTTVTFTQTAGNVAGGNVAAKVGVAAGSAIVESAVTATNGFAGVSQSADIAGNSAANTAFGTITVSNANDSFTGGTITIVDSAAAPATHTLNLGTPGSTDNLTDIAATINGWGAGTGIQAAVSQDGRTLTLSTTGGGTAASHPLVSGTNVASSLSLTGQPASGSSSTMLGTLALAPGGAAGDTLGGSMTIGTTTIVLGTSTGTAKTDTMANLASTINAGNYGIHAAISVDGKSMTFTSPDSKNISITPGLTNSDDASIGGTQNLTWSTQNRGQISSQYYSIGISSTNGVTDTSTTGGTSIMGMSFDTNGTNGVATISYSDAAGQSLSQTDLANSVNAQATLKALNGAIAAVAAQDGYIGAQINTLNAVSSVMATQQQNVVAAQNAVQATDYATAASNMSKYQILSQTGISALAQANSMQQEVLKLLQ